MLSINRLMTAKAEQSKQLVVNAPKNIFRNIFSSLILSKKAYQTRRLSKNYEHITPSLLVGSGLPSLEYSFFYKFDVK